MENLNILIVEGNLNKENENFKKSYENRGRWGSIFHIKQSLE